MPADLSVLQTDMHSHFIPGIDDGSKSIEETLQLIVAMKSLGYKKIITTPHIMSDYYRNTPEIIHAGMQQVKEALYKQNIDIDFSAAAEYYLDYEFIQKIKQKNLLTLSANYVLFELPFISEPPNLHECIFELQMAGYKPVLAHVERYPYWHRQYDKILSIKEKGVLLQLNINSLSGHYTLPVKTMAEKLIDENMIDLLGTDCHNFNHIHLLKHTICLPYLHKAIQTQTLLNNQL
jgi:tyrosine-protein phosphatase YwqE